MSGGPISRPPTFRSQEERDAIARELGYRDAASVRRPLAKTSLEPALVIIARLRKEVAERDALIAELQDMVNRHV